MNIRMQERLRNATPEQLDRWAERILDAGLADLVAFGRPFIANPDLPQRLQHRWPLATVSDPATLFGGTATGYTDYPIYTLQEKTL